jgi:exopolysaccharide biosynthesis WecB/TagA/CpsF family protein
VVFTPNIDHLVKLQTNKQFYEAYKNADWILCDSRIIFFLSRLLPQRILETIPGSSFFSSYYRYHKDDITCRIFLLGAAPKIAETAKRQINEKVEREIIVGAHSPSFGFDKNECECNEILDIINNSGANVLVVGIGAPKQEIWIAKYKSQLPNIKIFFALGATIDFEAGHIKRAPKVFQKIGLEWLYRLFKEPKRMYQRYIKEDLVFFRYFSKQLLGRYHDPFSE